MNGAKPGASACSWVKGGAGVLVGRSVNWSLGDSEGEESGERVLVLFGAFHFDLKQRESEMFRPLCSPARRAAASRRGRTRATAGVWEG